MKRLLSIFLFVFIPLVATIAAVDGGELNLATNELEYNDIHDINTSHETEFGFNTGFGIGTDKKESTLHPEKTTDITMVHGGHDTEQTTRATIGAGTITVGGNSESDLAGLNRDVSKSQEITRDQITHALDATVSVDNRIFTESGRENIAEQHEKLVDNVEQIGDGLRNNIVTKSIENAITDKETNLIEAIGDYIKEDRRATQLVSEHPELVQEVYGLTNLVPEEAQAVMQEYIDILGADGGFAGELAVSSVEGNIVGLAYQSADGTVRNITLNLANIDMTDPNAVMRAIYHETTNFEAHTKNEQTAINRGNTGAGIFDLKTYGTENTNSMTGKDWVTINSGSETIVNGNMSLINDITNYESGAGSVATDILPSSRMGTVLLRAAAEHEYVKGSVVENVAKGAALRAEIDNPETSGEVAVNAYHYLDEKDPNASVMDKVLFAAGAGVFNEQNINQREYDQVETSLNNPISLPGGDIGYMLNGDIYTQEEMYVIKENVERNLDVSKVANGMQAALAGIQMFASRGQAGSVKNPFYKPAKIAGKVGKVSTTASKAATGAGKQTLYRAVSAEEAASIANNGKFSVPPNGAEGKWFTTSYQNASVVKNDLSVKYPTPYTDIVKTSINKKDFDSMYQFTDHMPSGDVPTVYIPLEDLNKLGNPKIVK